MTETYTPHRTNGFTLIELSIVLVIIGLIVGGVLVGQDLIQAASIRSQITQLEKFNTATNAFRLKYNCLPGDCEKWQQFGFTARGPQNTATNGNRFIEGCDTGVYVNVSCEAALFWRDLSQAGLIEGSFNTATDVDVVANAEEISLYLPTAKLGSNKYVAVHGTQPFGKGNNFWFLGGIATISAGPSLRAGLGVTPVQAQVMDTKLDDGKPTTGNVVTGYSGPNGEGVVMHNDYEYYWSFAGCDTQNGTSAGISAYTLDGAYANSPDCWMRFKASF